MNPVHHIDVFIHRSAEDVYKFTSTSQNLKRWTAELAQSDVVNEKYLSGQRA